MEKKDQRFFWEISKNRANMKRKWRKKNWANIVSIRYIKWPAGGERGQDPLPTKLEPQIFVASVPSSSLFDSSCPFFVVVEFCLNKKCKQKNGEKTMKKWKSPWTVKNHHRNESDRSINREIIPSIWLPYGKKKKKRTNRRKFTKSPNSNLKTFTLKVRKYQHNGHQTDKWQIRILKKTASKNCSRNRANRIFNQKKNQRTNEKFGNNNGTNALSIVKEFSRMKKTGETTKQSEISPRSHFYDIGFSYVGVCQLIIKRNKPGRQPVTHTRTHHS